MAAGSVINDPANGTNDMVTKNKASSYFMGKMRAKAFTKVLTSSNTGRLAATTIMAKTNAGSVKLRVSTYATASSTPASTAMAATRTHAQTPNTASTSDNKCHRPAWGPPRLARRANTGTENV